MSRPDIDAILEAFRQDLEAATSPADIDEIKRVHTGKKSPIKLALRSLRDVDPAERPKVAQSINAARQTILDEVAAGAQAVAAKAIARQLEEEWLDLSMPGVGPVMGARHPLTIVENRCAQVMRQLGFELRDGPEVEDPYYNFDSLNIPEHHPARDMQDTFWVAGGQLLRSHTTTVQARVLKKKPPLPVRIYSHGRAYRNEAVDASHTAMFHQFEGIWVDRGLNFSHLKGTLAFIAKSLFGDNKIRFKPKFYPYTEPSIGVDLMCTVCHGSGCEACHGAGWVTILGAGMVHPNVFIEFGYDYNEVAGIAFGLGITRMAAQWSGVSRSRSLYDQDLRILQTLHRGGQ
ncbi:MAG: phenylalanine--tRNA ligase subunit alpha [Proteobacteria bacterium]|jgi:phenylalanyl-tRNA synthetase alpha chain|nr:phenylalanine--tRNA ligase subunit alpha [Pseudomonadota bacterium]